MKGRTRPARWLAYLVVTLLLAPPAVHAGCCPGSEAAVSLAGVAGAHEAGELREGLAPSCHRMTSHEQSHDSSVPPGGKLAHPCGGCVAHFVAIPPALPSSAVTKSVHNAEVQTIFLEFAPPPRTRPPIRA
jgi:hypothetical protein